MPNFLPEDEWKEQGVKEALDHYIDRLRIEHARRVNECLKALSPKTETGHTQKGSEKPPQN